MSTVGEDYPKQQARLRNVIRIYRSLPGGVGNIGALMVEGTLHRADRAIAGGDVVEILRMYEEMVHTADDIGVDDEPLVAP